MRAHHSRSRRAIAARVVWARPTTHPPPPVPFKGQAGLRFGGLGLCGEGWSFCSRPRPSRRGQRDPRRMEISLKCLPDGRAPSCGWAGSARPWGGGRGRGAITGCAALCRERCCTACCLRLLSCWGFPQLIRGGSRGQRRWFSAVRWVKLCRSESLLFVKLLE